MCALAKVSAPISGIGTSLNAILVLEKTNKSRNNYAKDVGTEIEWH